MNRKNYTYIVASTPILKPDFRPEEGTCRKMLEWMASQLDGDDLLKMKTVTDGFKRENLTREFYVKALECNDPFIRRFFTADLHLRNAKVTFLNGELGRPAEKDIIRIDGMGEIPDANEIDSILTVKDLLERERAMDRYLWNKADEITLFESFTLGKVLAIAVKLCIIERWLTLDRETGRQMLRKLTSDMRGTYGNIEFDTEI